MGTSARYLEIVRVLSSRRMLRVARELGLLRPKPPTDEGAEEFRAALEELGTTFIKLGQLLSTRPDLVSETYAGKLSNLQDRLDFLPTDIVRTIVETSLGRPLDQVFLQFDDAPLAAASIAQAHSALLLSGERVVVKVRRPGIVEQVEQDLEILERLAMRADRHVDAAHQMRIRTLVDELAYSLRRELDMRVDAANMQVIAGNLEGFERIQVPRVHEALVTEEVLVMEYVEGVKASDAIGLGAEASQELSEEFLRAYMKQILVDGIYHADPHAGNILLTPEGNIALLDFGLLGRIDENTRVEFGLMLLALAENRAEDFADMLLRMSATDRTSNEQMFHQEIRRLLPRYRNTSLDQISIGSSLVEIQGLAFQCRISLPIPFALMGKTLSQVDSIARARHPSIDPLEPVRSYATEVAWGQFRHTMTPSAMISLFGNPVLSLMQLPRRTEHLLERLERGEVTIGVTPTDLDEVMHSVATMVNRISTAMIIAASIVASAVLMHITEVGELWGYPALGLIGFLVSISLGTIVILRMLRTRGGL